MILIIYIALFCFILRFYYINKKFSNNEPIRCGWLAIPLFGHFYGVNFTKPFYEIYNNTKHLMNEKYGKHKLFSIWFMDSYMVFITDAYLAREFLVKNGENFLNRPITSATKLFSHNFSNLSQSRDQRWFDIRNTFSHMATNLLVRKKTHHIENKTKELIANLKDERNCRLSPNSIEIHKITKSYLLNLLFEYFNRSEPLENTIKDSRSQELIDNVLKFLSNTQGKPLLNCKLFCMFIATYHKITGLKIVYKPYKLIKELLIDDHIKTIDRNNPRDPIDELIILNESYPKHQQSEDNIISPIFDMFVPGLNTSSFILEWFMLLLSNYPLTQNSIYNELVNILNNENNTNNNINNNNDKNDKDGKDGINNDNDNDNDNDDDDDDDNYYKDFIGIKHKTQTPILNSAINEVIRYKMGTSGGPRTTKEDICIDGKFIPKGTGVAILTIAIFNDKEYWGNPEEFDPDRFLGDYDKIKPHLDRLLHFGVGKRQCPGKNIANDQIYLVCANMVLNFTWSSESGEKINEIPDFKLNSLPPPYKLILKKRN
ncbi:hypothetical protein RB653_000074 [Dictyostelium firmibasis]|uniref:Cytochrome P450 n=1 Tax=Dictyostelium firmibasis TaxID=79012 RepID=A0AAN7U2M8_9MYCE